MKSKEFITEDNQNKIVLISKNIIKKIQGDCSQFLSNAETPLYRGVRGSKTIVDERPIRTDRYPKNTHAYKVAAFNYGIEKKFGISNIRNKSAFVIGLPIAASTYGDLTLVFPINGTKYLYSPDVRDFFAVSGRGDTLFFYTDFINRYVDEMGLDEEKEKLVYRQLQECFIRLNEKKGIVSDSIIRGAFGKYVDAWKDYVGLYTNLINSFHLTATVPKDIKSEILLFDVPSYYTINIEMIENISKFIYIGNKKYSSQDEYLKLDIFNAIKTGEEVYYYEKL